MSLGADGALSVSLGCARSERRCRGSLRVLVAGHAIAEGRFVLPAPGGVVRLTPLGGAAGPASGETATVHAAYRNRVRAARNLVRRLVLKAPSR